MNFVITVKFTAITGADKRDCGAVPLNSFITLITRGNSFLRNSGVVWTYSITAITQFP